MLFIRFLLVGIFLFFGFHGFSLDSFNKNERVFSSLSSRNSSSAVIDVNKLSSFSDIVIIQRRFLSKTGRFELSPSFLLFLSSEFFINMGIGGSFSFYFLEKHGLELFGLYSVIFTRNVTRDLANNLGFHGEISGDRTESVMALVYKWIPIYGKMAFFDKKIVPFDVSLSIGGGLVRSICGQGGRDAQGLGGFELGLCQQIQSGDGKTKRKKWEPAVILGVGQAFAVSKNTTLGLKINWIYYGAFTGNAHHSDISLSTLWSMYFPHKKIR